MEWELQLYGGDYYDESRVGAYGVFSKVILSDFTVTGEVLRENYGGGSDGGVDDYQFAGVGGHLLWNMNPSVRVGLVGSVSEEEYTYGAGFEDPNSEFVSRTLGLEGELNLEPVTVAVQVGESFNDFDNDDHYYLSSDLYYWGPDYLWYGRGAIRTTNNYEEYALEGYRSLSANGLPLLVYLGVTRNDLTTEEEIRTYRTQYDSYYLGGYIEFASTTFSLWNLWVEAARQDGDMVYSVELNVAFGPGADAPYISAFGFTP